MELRLVTFEQAKALKELGFPQGTTNKFYYKSTDETFDYWDIQQYSTEKDFCAAPVLELVAKWLREEKDIDLWVRRLYSWTPKEGTRKVGYHFEGDWQTEVITRYPTYEEALNAGVDTAIKILKAIEILEEK